MRGFFKCAALGFALAIAAVFSVYAGESLSETEVNAAVDEVFGTARKITHLECQLITQKEGGAFGDKPAKSYGLLRLSTPNLMWLQDYGTDEAGNPRATDPGIQRCAITLVDGKYVWDIQPSEEQGEPSMADRMQLNDQVAGGHAANIAAVLGTFMGLGEDIAGAQDIRRTFSLQGEREPLTVGGKPVQDGRAAFSNKFILKPLDEENTTLLTIWHRPADKLPWKVQTKEVKTVVSRRNPQGREVTEITTRVLANTRTNLDGLPAIPPSAFTVPASLKVKIAE
jgi:hypothetical protein